MTHTAPRQTGTRTLSSLRAKPRRKADEWLLQDGPQNVQSLKSLMAKLVDPGRAARQAARTRRTESNPRHGDPYAVGAWAIATATVSNTTRSGVWIREGDVIRHRDWVGVVVA
jgi:hypothetical protein